MTDRIYDEGQWLLMQAKLDLAAEWDESLHPRDERGRFGEKGAGSEANGATYGERAMPPGHGPKGYITIYRGVNPDRNRVASSDASHGLWYTTTYEDAVSYANWDAEGEDGLLAPHRALLAIDVPLADALDYARAGSRHRIDDPKELLDPDRPVELLVDRDAAEKAVVIEGDEAEGKMGLPGASTQRDVPLKSAVGQRGDVWNQSAAGEWEESEHPRDERGRFSDADRDPGGNAAYGGVQAFERLVGRPDPDIHAPGPHNEPPPPSAWLVKTNAARWAGWDAEHPKMAKAADAAVRKRLDGAAVWVRVTPEILTRVLDDGRLKSQFESGTSGGALAPDYRAEQEVRMFSLPPDLNAPERPIYGYATNQPDGLADDGHLAHYGDVAIKLKPEVVDRSTVCFGDSLIRPTPLPMPVATADHHCIAPENTFGRVHSVLQLAKNPKYVEAQVHRGVSVADIAEVRFMVKGPDKGMAERLTALGIKHEAAGEVDLAADWDESEHPRADDGRFAEVEGVHETTPPYADWPQASPTHRAKSKYTNPDLDPADMAQYEKTKVLPYDMRNLRFEAMVHTPKANVFGPGDRSDPPPLSAWLERKTDDLWAERDKTLGRQAVQELDDLAHNALRQASVWTRVSNEATLEKILEGRFRSQFETGSSGGALDPMARARSEAQQFSLPPNVNPVDRPIYGYASQHPDGGLVETDDIWGSRDAVAQYGRIAIRFRPEVKGRTTVTFGDSLQPWDADTVRPMPFLTADRRAIVDPHVTAPTDDYRKRITEWSYTEAQIHRGLGPSDITEIVSKEELSPSMRERLDKLGIKHRTLSAKTSLAIDGESAWLLTQAKLVLAATEWDEAEHPRDEKGQWADKDEATLGEDAEQDAVYPRDGQGRMLIAVVHRTTPEAAKSIADGGFTLEHFGGGAGLGMLEEPAGIFVSPVGTEGDFAKENSDRDLGMTSVVRATVEARRIWRPTRDERYALAKDVERGWIADKYKITPEKAEVVRKVGPVSKLREWGLSEIAKDATSARSEVEFKKHFANYLVNRGYDAMQWREPVRGVNQLLVFNPAAIRVQQVGHNLAAEWDEAEHPRDDHGRFAETEGASEDRAGGAGAPRAFTSEEGYQWHEQGPVAEWAKGVPYADANAVTSYASFGYHGINDQLRGTYTPRIIAEFMRVATPEDIAVYNTPQPEAVHEKYGWDLGKRVEEYDPNDPSRRTADGGRVVHSVFYRPDPDGPVVEWSVQRAVPDLKAVEDLKGQAEKINTLIAEHGYALPETMTVERGAYLPGVSDEALRQMADEGRSMTEPGFTSTMVGDAGGRAASYPALGKWESIYNRYNGAPGCLVAHQDEVGSAIRFHIVLPAGTKVASVEALRRMEYEFPRIPDPSPRPADIEPEYWTMHDFSATPTVSAKRLDDKSARSESELLLGSGATFKILHVQRGPTTYKGGDETLKPVPIVDITMVYVGGGSSEGKH